MTRATRLRLALLVPLVATAALAAPPRADDAPVVPPRQGTPETVAIFDGKSLDGWVGHEKYWAVHDGVIVGKNEGKVPVSTYLLTKKNFSDFRLTGKGKTSEIESHLG